MPEPALRVCVPIAQYPPLFSGHGIQTRRTLPYLAARGIEVTILTSRLPRRGVTPPADEPGTVDRILAPGTDIVSTLRRAVQLRRYFSRHRGRFDLVHCSLLEWEFLVNTPFLASLGLPILVEMVLLGADDPLTVSRERFGSLKMGLLKHVDVWVGISRTFLPRLQQAGIAAERFRLVHTGVDLETYRPRTGDARRSLRSRLGLPPEARIVVSVGSVIRRKGVDRVLDVWSRLSPRPGRDLLAIVGPVSTEDGLRTADRSFAESVRARAEAADLKGTVRWIGQVQNVDDYLGAADLFLFLSRQEGLGTVILEALASGLPCVVSPLDGIAEEILSDGRCGVIARDPDDAAAVARSMAPLLDQPPLREAMGALARQTAVARFSLEARAEALASIYRNLTGGDIERPAPLESASVPGRPRP
jgi:glycosyltransferase involved in cell wall biosynthesis